MCFNQSLILLSLMRDSAGSLSTNKLLVGLTLVPVSSLKACQVHTKWLAARDAAMYSASQVDRATQDCRFEDHEIVEPLTFMM
jgi:hypothetical protein